MTTPAAPTMTETELLNAVLQLADTFGWRAMHPRPARTQHGWRTPVQGPGAAGFPDLVLVHTHPARFLVRELKAPRGKLSDDQIAWIADLQMVGIDAGVWQPSDWPTIVHTLTFGRGR